MFSKNLSLTILQLCSSRDLSYEKAEKLCKGLELTLNELLRVLPLSDPRLPMSVVESRFVCGLGCYPVCPYCKLTLDREYQHFCDRCCQELDWKDYSNAIIIFPGRS